MNPHTHLRNCLIETCNALFDGKEKKRLQKTEDDYSDACNSVNLFTPKYIEEDIYQHGRKPVEDLNEHLDALHVLQDRLRDAPTMRPHHETRAAAFLSELNATVPAICKALLVKINDTRANPPSFDLSPLAFWGVGSDITSQLLRVLGELEAHVTATEQTHLKNPSEGRTILVEAGVIQPGVACYRA